MSEDQKKGFIFTLKQVYWELLSPHNRFGYLQYFFSEVPGFLGEVWRKKFYRKYFGSCGERLTVYQGVRIRNIHLMSIGDDVFLGWDNAFQAGGGLDIGDRVAFGPGCKIWTINHKFDEADKPVMEQGYDYKKVTIGNDVWVAANVFIMPGVEIPEGCIIAAGSVVGIKKYPPFSIISGNPARVIGNRLKKKEQPADKKEGE